MTFSTLALAMGTSTARAACTCSWDVADNKTLTISNCSGGQLSSLSCANQKTANNVIVGTGFTNIGESAFTLATGLTSITIPEGVTSKDTDNEIIMTFKVNR